MIHVFCILKYCFASYIKFIHMPKQSFPVVRLYICHYLSDRAFLLIDHIFIMALNHLVNVIL